jgi:hypothetical protein
VVVVERLSVIEVPLGAGPLRVIVAVAFALPPICAGEKVKPASVGGCTVRVAVCWTPWLETVMVTGAELLTGSVFTWNCAVVLPAGTFTLVGTVAMAALALLKATLSPPAGAGPVSVIVPCTVVVRPITVLGLTVRLLGTILPSTARFAERVAPR